MTSRKRKHSPSCEPSSSTVPPPPAALRRSARRPQPRHLSEDLARGVSSQPSLTATSFAESDEWSTVKDAAINRLDQYQLEKDNKKLKCCLKALLDWLPKEGRDSLAHDISNAKSDEMIYTTYENLLSCLLTPIKLCGGKTPKAIDSPYSKRTEHVDEEYQKMGPSESAQCMKEFRSGCLTRENFRCIATNALDEDKWEEEGADEQVFFGVLEEAHIIPYSLGEHSSELERSKLAKTWENVHRCFPATKKVIRASTINDVTNGICLHRTIHHDFDRFRCAFEKVPDESDTYKFITFRRFSPEMKPRIREKVTFRAAGGFPTPEPALLECHYTLAQVFNATGMGEEIDLKIRHWEDLKEEFSGCSLAADGSTDVGSLIEAGMAMWTVPSADAKD